MKNLKARIESALRNEPHFRERSERWKLFMRFTYEKYPSLSGRSGLPIPPEYLRDAMEDWVTMKRTWNLVTKENEELRGNDYNDKIILEQEAELDLGYAPGFDRDVSKNVRDKML